VKENKGLASRNRYRERARRCKMRKKRSRGGWDGCSVVYVDIGGRSAFSTIVSPLIEELAGQTGRHQQRQTDALGKKKMSTNREAYMGIQISPQIPCVHTASSCIWGALSAVPSSHPGGTIGCPDSAKLLKHLDWPSRQGVVEWKGQEGSHDEEQQQQREARMQKA
jgi:hypothetical protein